MFSGNTNTEHTVTALTCPKVYAEKAAKGRKCHQKVTPLPPVSVTFLDEKMSTEKRLTCANVKEVQC